MASGLEERGRGLEEAFFARENERLRQQIREAGSTQGLAAASGIADASVSRNLEALNVQGDVAAAIALVPLIAVAWADGDIQDTERDALLRAATDSGLAKGGAAYQAFEGFLARRPDAAVLGQWKSYIALLSAEMEPGAREALRRETIGKARRVAEAAGGFLGIGAISTQEKTVLDELERAFPA